MKSESFEDEILEAAGENAEITEEDVESLIEQQGGGMKVSGGVRGSGRVENGSMLSEGRCVWKAFIFS